MRIPIAPASTEIEVKRSRFIAIAEPVTNTEEMKAMISAVRNQHPQANHVVHAAIMGEDGAQFSFSDDHEPKHTAGRPMLEVLKGSNTTNILLMVVRYFGGTLLGTGGLVNAYGDAAKAVLSILKTEELIHRTTLEITIDYDIYEQVQNLLNENKSQFTADFATQVTIEAIVPTSQVETVSTQITNLSAGTAVILVTQAPEHQVVQ